MARDEVEPSRVLSGRLEPGDGSGPVLVIGERRIPWALVGEVLAGSGCVELAISVGPTAVSGEAHPVMSSADGPLLRVVPSPLEPRAALRRPVDQIEAEAWAEAVTLLRECLPDRYPCPIGDLAAACAGVRGAVAAGREVWEMVGDAAGWDDGPPPDDVDLWTGAAMALISVAVDGMNGESARCLDAMELDDWLSTVLELVRSGPGTAADPESLLALSARCLDVDTAAVDPALAPIMVAAFQALIPVWIEVGAVDASVALTPLGAWGLPYATSRAWGGWIDTA